MVKLLRLCVDHGTDNILAIKHKLPQGIVPTVEIIRSQLREDPGAQILYFKQDISVISTDLAKYDERCGVMSR